MRYVEEFRDPAAARALVARIAEHGARLDEAGRSVNLMEVCGSHTMAIARFGVRGLLPEPVHLLSGPGCPVCVTGAGYIDAAIELAAGGAIVASFGDLLRVPGSAASLADARAEGAHVEVCYSPEGALDLARRHPEREVVFLAVGFETTIAPVVSLVPAAAAEDLRNVSLLTAFKRVPPALDALVADPEVRVDAFLCPGHASIVIGSEAYRPLVEEQGLPCVVAGFEPLDVLHAIEELLAQLVAGTPRLENQYARVVRPEGNHRAQELIARFLVPVDDIWRGLGAIPRSGYGLREEYRAFDARRRFGVEVSEGRHDPRCRCGEVLKGITRPEQCALFGRACTPDTPIGACMVSSEGSCAAAFKYAEVGG